jgi:hypothetical protein
MTAEQATLIAAIIAAFSSVVTLVMGVFVNRSTEMRVSHRQALESHISELAKAIYSTIATSKILTQAKTEPAIENWRARAEEAKTKLKELRGVLRYPLWGITDAMNTLARLPDWIEHSRPFPEYSRDLCTKGHALGSVIDSAIRRSYNNGRPPTIYERLRVKIAEKRLVDAYEKMKADRSLTSDSKPQE